MEDISKIAIHQAVQSARHAWFAVAALNLDMSSEAALTEGASCAAQCAKFAEKTVSAADAGQPVLATKYAQIATRWQEATEAAIEAAKALRYAEERERDAQNKDGEYIALIEAAKYLEDQLLKNK